MGKHYSKEFKEKVLKDYKLGTYGGRNNLAKYYGLTSSTIWNWIAKERNQGNSDNDVFHTRGRKSEKEIDYKEKYEILKKYQAFLKAQREKK